MPLAVPALTWLLATAVFCLVIALFALCSARAAQRAALQRLRDRLAADLHDDIGANLSQLTILSEVLHHQVGAADPRLANSLHTLAQISRETMSALGDIVWATNPQQDGLPNLLRRMRRFVSETLPAAGIEFSFHAPPLQNEWRLDAELRRQVFLIFKESLNNLVRHSGCTRAVIELQIEGAYLTLCIRDNGSGFASAPSAEGNGLPNLQRRAKTLGASLSITSSPQGTAILLRARHCQTTWQLARQRLIVLKRQDQHRLRLFGALPHTYLNRGVTALVQRPTLPSQPISAALEKSPMRH